MKIFNTIVCVCPSKREFARVNSTLINSLHGRKNGGFFYLLRKNIFKLMICCSFFISGFTALTEKYSAMATADGTSGTDKLSATLNAYIGKIVDGMILLC